MMHTMTESKRNYPPKNGKSYLTKRTEVRFKESQYKWLVNQQGSIGDTVRDLIDKKIEQDKAR